MRVMVVDDSVVYRSQIKQILDNSGFTVVKTAANGRLALNALLEAPDVVDVVVIDLEMPVMDGLTTIKEIREKGLLHKIVVFASLTKASAETTMAALAAGADDFVVKPGGATTSLDAAVAQIREQLLPRLEQFGSSRLRASQAAADTKIERPVKSPRPQSQGLDSRSLKMIVIASSTGGPQALETFFKSVRTPFLCPVVIAQHMPPVFTKSLAERLGRIASGPAIEAQHNELLVNNHIYVCPGDFHCEVFQSPYGPRILLNQNARRNSVRPCANFLFESAATLYGRNCLGIVLTGMGEDGKDGCHRIKEAGGFVMIQDQATSAVWGMPGAVHESGQFDVMLGLESLGEYVDLAMTPARRVAS